MTPTASPAPRPSLGERALGLLLQGAFGFLRALGPVRASNLAGWVARSIGRHLPVCRVADANLRRSLPELSAADRRRIIASVWDMVGRNAGELPHLADLHETPAGPGWEIRGRENIPPGPAIFFAAHMGNWEMILPIASQLGLAVSGFYRRPSNSTVDQAVLRLRMAALRPGAALFPKGAQGARQALAHVMAGGSLGLLVDQKMNDGIAAPFFGRDAMTAPAAAQFSLRFGLPLVPIHMQRLGPARVRMTCEAALDVPPSGDRQADILALTTAMNRRIEDWVRADPGSWLWLHKRWPKAAGDAAAAPKS